MAELLGYNDSKIVQNRNELVSGDLNNYLVPGIYTINKDQANIENCPIYYGLAIVYQGKFGWIVQQCIAVDGSGIKFRCRNNTGQWIIESL